MDNIYAGVLMFPHLREELIMIDHDLDRVRTAAMQRYEACERYYTVFVCSVPIGTQIDTLRSRDIFFIQYGSGDTDAELDNLSSRNMNVQVDDDNVQSSM